MRAEKICGIYQIRNIINNKKIIGLSKNIYKRWEHHKYHLKRNIHDNPYLQSAWNKYGENNFTFEIILLCTINELGSEEMRLIIENKSNDANYGYNLSSGGEFPKMSEETKRKISEASKGENNVHYGKHHSAEHKRKISDALKGKQKGKIISNTTREKISESLKGRQLSEETKRKIGMASKVMHLSKGHKIKIGESLKNMEPNENHKRKIRLPLSEDCKRKISNSLKGHQLSEDCKRKISNSLKGKQLSEDHKRKIREGLKERFKNNF